MGRLKCCGPPGLGGKGRLSHTPFGNGYAIVGGGICAIKLIVGSKSSEPGLSSCVFDSSDPDCPGAVAVNTPTVPRTLCPELSDSESVAELPVDGSVIVDVFP